MTGMSRGAPIRRHPSPLRRPGRAPLSLEQAPAFFRRHFQHPCCGAGLFAGPFHCPDQQGLAALCPSDRKTVPGPGEFTNAPETAHPHHWCGRPCFHWKLLKRDLALPDGFVPDQGQYTGKIGQDHFIRTGRIVQAGGEASGQPGGAAPGARKGVQMSGVRSRVDHPGTVCGSIMPKPVIACLVRRARIRDRTFENQHVRIPLLERSRGAARTGRYARSGSGTLRPVPGFIRTCPAEMQIRPQASAAQSPGRFPGAHPVREQSRHPARGETGGKCQVQGRMPALSRKHLPVDQGGINLPRGTPADIRQLFDIAFWRVRRERGLPQGPCLFAAPDDPTSSLLQPGQGWVCAIHQADREIP